MVEGYDGLRQLLLSGPVAAARASYRCMYIDTVATIFEPTEGTGRVMIPTDLLLEYINALRLNIINARMDPRTMREQVKGDSVWAPYQHGFETHISAVVRAWAASR